MRVESSPTSLEVLENGKEKAEPNTLSVIRVIPLMPSTEDLNRELSPTRSLMPSLNHRLLTRKSSKTVIEYIVLFILLYNVTTL